MPSSKNSLGLSTNSGPPWCAVCLCGAGFSVASSSPESFRAPVSLLLQVALIGRSCRKPGSGAFLWKVWTSNGSHWCPRSGTMYDPFNHQKRSLLSPESYLFVGEASHLDAWWASVGFEALWPKKASWTGPETSTHRPIDIQRPNSLFALIWIPFAADDMSPLFCTDSLFCNAHEYKHDIYILIVSFGCGSKWKT